MYISQFCFCSSDSEQCPQAFWDGWRCEDTTHTASSGVLSVQTGLSVPLHGGGGERDGRLTWLCVWLSLEGGVLLLEFSFMCCLAYIAPPTG